MRTLVILLFITLSRAFCQDAAGVPVIFHVSPTAVSGDVIYIQGSGFGAAPAVQYSHNDSNWVSLAALTSGSETVMVRIPASDTRLPDLVTVRVSPDGANWSAPVYLNQAAALSFDTNQIGAGNQFRIFGRNLLFSHTPTVRLVDTADGSSHSASVETGSSTAYALRATAPSDIRSNRSYSVYVSNGYNGTTGSGGETVASTILQGRSNGQDYWGLNVPWAADLNFTGNIYNVQSDPRLGQHSNGDGSANDINVIQGAINAASNAGGGIVYLPAGTYDLYYSNGCGLTFPPRVVLMGAGTTNTFVNFGFGQAPSAGDGGWAVCFVNTFQTGASDITFTNVNQSGNWPQTGTALSANEVFLQRTKWNMAQAQWMAFQNDVNATIQNSSFTQGLDPSYNGPLSLLGSSNFVVRGNTVKYVAGTLLFDRTINGVFEDNNVIRDASQSAPPGVISHVVVGSFATNLAMLHNIFSVSGGTLPQRNDGETIGSESGGDVRYDEFRGMVTSAGSNYISDSTQNFNWSSNNAVPNLSVGAIVAIVAGKGAGQWAVVSAVSSDGHTAYINKPWVVAPVYGSRYATFDWSAANWIVAGNTLSNNEKGIEFFNASVRNIQIVDNVLTNNGEILFSPTEAPDGAGLFSVVQDTQVLNNTLTDNDNLRPAAISAVSREDNQVNNLGTAILGFEVRGNTINAFNPNTRLTDISLDDAKALTEGVNLYWQWQTPWSNFQDDGIPSILGTVVQGNTLHQSLTAIHMNSGVSQTVLVANALDNVGSSEVNDTLPGATHAAIGTLFLTGAPPKGPSASPQLDAWNQLTVGSLSHSSLASEPSSTTSFVLKPSLYQIGTGPDSFSMLAESVPSDLTAVAWISIPGNASAATQGSLVFRASSDPLSAFVSFGQLQNGWLNFEWRAYQTGAVGGYSFPHAQTPVWVKLVKNGNLLQAYYSEDGSSWQYGGMIGAAFNSVGFKVGLESLSDTTSGPSITFAHVDVP